MEYRVVIFADILGFKAMVKQTPLREIAEKVSRLVERSKVNQIGGSVEFRVGHTHFSDALLLWGPDMAGRDIKEQINIRKALMMRASSFLGCSIADEIPLRMGVAEGEVIINPEKNIYVGQPIIDAYLLESQQQWIGGAVHPSFRSDDLLASPHRNLVRYDIPYKENSNLQPKIAVNWQYFTINNSVISVDCLREKICKMRNRAEAGVAPEERESVFIKYENSLRFLDWASNNQQNNSTRENCSNKLE